MTKSPAAVTRRPVMMPGRYAGTQIPRGRSIKITVGDDGSLLVRDPQGTRAVAGPHEITRAVILDKGQAPRWADPGDLGASIEMVAGPLQLLALMAGPRPVLVIRLNEFSPHPIGGTGDPAIRMREQTGADALCHALGLPLEAPTAAEVAAVRGAQGHAAAVLLDDPWVRGRRSAPFVTLLAGVVAFAAWLFGFGAATAAVSVVSALLVLPTVWFTFRGRQLFFRVADSDLSADGVRFTPTQPPTRGLRDAWLLMSAERFVFHCRGLEVVAAGPALGGVVACDVWDDLVYFKDSRGQTLLSVARPVFFDDTCLEQLETLSRELGLAWNQYRAPVASVAGREPVNGDEGLTLARNRKFAGLTYYTYQTGGPGGLTPWLSWVVTVMLFGTGIGLFLAQSQPWAAPFFAAYAVMFAMNSYGSVRLYLWSARQRRKVRHVLPGS